jgi:hypothetical protein
VACLDERDDLVDVRERDGETFQHVAAFARLAQFVARTAHDDFAPVLKEILEKLLEVEERGWPSTSATMFIPKLSCSCVSL